MYRWECVLADSITIPLDFYEVLTTASQRHADFSETPIAFRGDPQTSFFGNKSSRANAEELPESRIPIGDRFRFELTLFHLSPA